MTREERLDWLCRLRSGLVWFDVPPKERPMFEDALSEEIKALSAEPCEDCISRRAVMDAMYELCGEGSLKDDPWRDNPHIDSIIDAIEHLPSVTPKQKMCFDGMTNGEKFKEVFRISQVDEGELDAFVWLPNHDAIAISIEWWNAPYNAESEEAEWLK